MIILFSIGWVDIGYSFLIGGDGKVYEGRGWGIEGAHTCCRYYNRIGHGIAFIGTYTTSTPSSSMINAAQKLIQCGVNRVGIVPAGTTLMRSQTGRYKYPVRIEQDR